MHNHTFRIMLHRCFTHLILHHWSKIHPPETNNPPNPKLKLWMTLRKVGKAAESNAEKAGEVPGLGFRVYPSPNIRHRHYA